MSTGETLQCGEMDNKCALYHRVITKNEQGEDVTTWPVAYDTAVWTRKRDLRGQKRLTAQAFSNDQWSEFRTRYRSDLLITDRLTDNRGNLFEITSSAEVGRRVGLDLLCRQIVK
jgi:SPP1 family predicted phage head-tail adaptor